RQGHRVEHDLRFGEWKRGQNLTAERLGRHGPLNTSERFLSIALVGSEEEGFPSDDGAAERTAELVEHNVRLRCRRRQENVARVQRVSLIVLQERSVKRVRARLADQIDLSADHTA